MDLALNNLQRLICHKAQTTNQPTKSKSSVHSITQQMSVGIETPFMFSYNNYIIISDSNYCSTIWVARADDSFVCFGAKPDKGFSDLKSRRIRKW